MGHTISKITYSSGGISTPSNTWFLVPIKFSPPNGIWISSAVFAGLTDVCCLLVTLVGPADMEVTNRHTDHITVTIGCILCT